MASMASMVAPRALVVASMASKASMVAPLEWLKLMAAEPKSGEEQVDGLTHKICEERADGLTLKIDGERAEGLPHKICEERADGWTSRKVVEQMLVDGDGYESGGCNMAQVTPSTELRECANRKVGGIDDLGGDDGVDGGGMVASMASMASMVVASMASTVARWRRWRRWMASMASMVGVDGGGFGLRHRGH